MASSSSVSIHKYIFPMPTIKYSYTLYTNLTPTQTFHFCFKAASRHHEEWPIYECIIVTRSQLSEWHTCHRRVHVLHVAWDSQHLCITFVLPYVPTNSFGYKYGIDSEVLTLRHKYYWVKYAQNSLKSVLQRLNQWLNEDNIHKLNKTNETLSISRFESFITAGSAFSPSH